MASFRLALSRVILLYFVAEFGGRGSYLHSLVLMVSDELRWRHLASFFSYFYLGRCFYSTINIERLLTISIDFVISRRARRYSSSSSCSCLCTSCTSAQS